MTIEQEKFVITSKDRKFIITEDTRLSNSAKILNSIEKANKIVLYTTKTSAKRALTNLSFYSYYNRKEFKEYTKADLEVISVNLTVKI